jgi:hypothetical protein
MQIPKRSRRKGDEMASKLVIPILFGVICVLTVVTAWENGNFKDSQVISMPTATAEKNISILVMQVYFKRLIVTFSYTLFEVSTKLYRARHA